MGDVPLLVTVIAAVNPVPQSLDTEYEAEHEVTAGLTVLARWVAAVALPAAPARLPASSARPVRAPHSRRRTDRWLGFRISVLLVVVVGEQSVTAYMWAAA